MNPAQQYHYVFDDLKHNMLVFSLVPAGTIVIFILIAFIRPRYYTDKYGRTKDRIIDSVQGATLFMILFALLYAALFYQLRMSYHCAVTTGRLLNKEYHRSKGSGGWQYIYEYTASAKTYREKEAYTQRMENTPVVGNCYTVLYDSTDPGNAIMILHEERNCALMVPAN